MSNFPVCYFCEAIQLFSQQNPNATRFQTRTIWSQSDKIFDEKTSDAAEIFYLYMATQNNSQKLIKHTTLDKTQLVTYRALDLVVDGRQWIIILRENHFQQEKPIFT